MATKTNTAEGGSALIGTAVGTSNSGGESGDAWSAVTGNAIVFGSTYVAPVNGGSVSHKVTSGTGSAHYLSWSGLNSADFAVQFWIYLTGTPVASDQRLLQTMVGATGVGGIAINGLTLKLQEGTGMLAASVSSTLSTNTWYLVNYIHNNAASATHSYEIWNAALDTQIFAYGPRTFTPTSSANLDTVRWGRILTGADFGGDAYFDNFVVVEQATMMGLPVATINLLDKQRATGTDTDGTAARFNAVNATLASTTAQFKSGTRSLEVTASAAANVTTTASTAVSADSDPTPIRGSTQYTAVASCRAHASAVGGKDTGVHIYWMNAAGGWCTPQSSIGSYVQANSSGWNKVYVTATSPSDAVRAFVRITNQTSVNIGDIWYWDELGMWEGSGITWVEPTNLLTLNQWTGSDDLENTTGFVVSSTGVTLTSATDQKYSGARSVKAMGDGSATYQGVKVSIPAGTFTAGVAYIASFRYRVSVGSVDYTVGLVNDWRGTVEADSRVRTADTWLQWTTAPFTLTASEAGQSTYLQVQRDAASASTVWIDDISVAPAPAVADGTTVTYGRLITIGG